MKNILELYHKATFTIEDNELINNAIDNGLIDTTTIKENFLDYVYHNLGNRFELEDIWDYTDENYSNGCTHIENYNNLLQHLAMTNKSNNKPTKLSSAELIDVKIRILNKFQVHIKVSDHRPGMDNFFNVKTAELSLWDAIGGRQLAYRLIHLTDIEQELRDMLPEMYFADVWELVSSLDEYRQDIDERIKTGRII